MSIRAVAAALVVAVAAGCVSVPPRAVRDPRPFDLLGRVLVAYDNGAFTANVRWQHSAPRDELWLMTPMGQTVAQVVDGAEGAVLTRSDHETYRADSVEALTQRALGWALPLSLMQYWVRGEPAPGFGVSDIERSGERITALTQNGWRVAITYSNDGDSAGRVRRLDLKASSNEIRFVVDTWRKPEDA